MTRAHHAEHSHEPPPDSSSAAASSAHIDQAKDILASAHNEFGSSFAVVSSFGAESAVLLHLTAQINTDIPVIFLDTGKLFGETKRYRDQLISKLGLTQVITIKAEPETLASQDPKGDLWLRDHNRCCFIRKVVPFRAALSPYRAWASGRKRYQSLERAGLRHRELADGKTKVNPLAGWSKDQIALYMKAFDLPAHPLVKDGFLSIGCMPCTDRTTDDTNDRTGRWQGKGKTECGIHLSLSDNIRLMNR